jgi:hypothetical protein
MRCVPALFLLFTLVATTIFVTSVEVKRLPVAPGETCSAGLPPAGCGVELMSMPSGSSHGGGKGGRGCGGAEIGGGGGRAGRDEGAKASHAQNGPSSTGCVWVASETLISVGQTRILGSVLKFFLPLPSFRVLIYDISLERTHNWQLF